MSPSEYQEPTWTHKGFFGICPVYVANPDSPMPCITPRHEYLDVLIHVSEYSFAFYFWLRSLWNPEYDGTFPILLTARLPAPIPPRSAPLP